MRVLLEYQLLVILGALLQIPAIPFTLIVDDVIVLYLVVLTGIVLACVVQSVADPVVEGDDALAAELDVLYF